MTATCKSSSNHYRDIRGPFWEKGRHIVNIRINKKVINGFGIGIVDTSFDISSNKYVGSTENSYSYYQDGIIYNNGGKAIEKTFGGYKDGDIVTVDINLYNNTLNWELNGNRLTQSDAITNIPKCVALAANLYYKGDSVQIVQYYRM